MGFTVLFNIKGFFVKDPDLKYIGGDLHAHRNLDLDYWSYFEALSLAKEIDSTITNEGVRLWWKPADLPMDSNLKLLKVDIDAVEMGGYAIEHNTEVDLFVEYNVNQFEVVDCPVCVGIAEETVDKGKNLHKGKAVGKGKSVEKRKAVGKGKNVDKGQAEDSEDSEDSDYYPSDTSEDSVEGIWFDDSDEEFVMGLDDCFEEEVAVDDAECSRLPCNRRLFEENVEIIPVSAEIDAMHPIENEYLTDELDSAADDDSDPDNAPRATTQKFAPEELNKDYKFTVGMEFNTLGQFKDAIFEHNVLNGKEVEFIKNDKDRVRFRCTSNDICDYEVYCSRVVRSHTFRLKTLQPDHTCGRIFHNKSAKAKWVAKVLVDKMRANSSIKLTEVINDIRTKYSVEITAHRAFKARQIARKIIDGDCARQYSLLWSYSAELRKANPGNTCKMHLERPSPNLQPTFGRFYLCFEGCKRAFKTACRPFVGVDGCHLKNKYGGQLLIAVGRDPNDQYLPMAFAVVETETKDSWRWFLTLLLEDIGGRDNNRWTFISDQQKGLVQTFEELAEDMEHRFCLRHLYANMKKKFGGGTLIRDLMMGAAKATYFEAWEEKMLQLKEADERAYNWLSTVPTKQWCKHAFPFHSKCDVLMNNLSESFNATILMQRDKPIITMFEWIRTYLMGRFASLREKVRKFRGEIMPKPRKRLDREIEMSGNWFATWAGGCNFEVTHSLFVEKFVVDLQNRTCSCNFWELVGIPCRHAVAAIFMKGDDPAMYVSRYYSRVCYEDCYDQIISPINGQKKWPRTDLPEVLPPQYKRGPGRPKKLRRREPDEDTSKTKGKWSRTNTTNRCKRCLKYGHNSRTCKNPPVHIPTPATTDATNTPQDGVQPNAAVEQLLTQTSQVNTGPAVTKKRGRPRGVASAAATGRVVTRSVAAASASGQGCSSATAATGRVATRKKTATVATAATSGRAPWRAPGRAVTKTGTAAPLRKKLQIRKCGQTGPPPPPPNEQQPATEEPPASEQPPATENQQPTTEPPPETLAPIPSQVAENNVMDPDDMASILFEDYESVYVDHEEIISTAMKNVNTLKSISPTPKSASRLIDTLKGFNGAVEKAVETIQSPVKNSPVSKEAVDQTLQVLLRGLAKFNANMENINEDDSANGPAS